MTKVITVNIDKGGTGKTTVAVNLADYTAHDLYKKTLLIDGDRSKNATDFYSNSNGKSTISDLFLGNEVSFNKVTDTLDILEGSQFFKDDSLQLQSKQNNCMILYMWFADNYDRIKDYEYIIIDTHNDTSLVTLNCLAVANIVIGVANPSVDAFKGWKKLNASIKKLKQDVVDPISRVSYIKAEEYLLGNQIDTRQKESKDFLDVAQNEDKYIGMIQDRQIIGRTLSTQKTIFDSRKQLSKSEEKDFQGFFDNTINVFNRIINL